MTIDLETYSLSKKLVQDRYLDRYKGDPRRAITQISSGTMIPCIVIAYYIGPVCDWHPDLVSNIKSLIDFYGYTEILNKPEGSPL